MEKLNRKLLGAYVRATTAVKSFIHGERGDTNFISILIILGIVVVFAGLFLTLGKDVFATMTESIKKFFEDIGATWTEASKS